MRRFLDAGLVMHSKPHSATNGVGNDRTAPTGQGCWKQEEKLTGRSMHFVFTLDFTGRRVAERPNIALCSMAMPSVWSFRIVYKNGRTVGSKTPVQHISVFNFNDILST